MATSQILGFLGVVVGMAAVVVFSIGFFPDESYKGPIPERGYIMNKRRQLAANSPIYALITKILLVFSYWIEKLPIEGLRKRLGMRLARAGHLGGWTADELSLIHI